jgi:hypothetical protein
MTPSHPLSQPSPPRPDAPYHLSPSPAFSLNSATIPSFSQASEPRHRGASSQVGRSKFQRWNDRGGGPISGEPCSYKDATLIQLSVAPSPPSRGSQLKSAKEVVVRGHVEDLRQAASGRRQEGVVRHTQPPSPRRQEVDGWQTVERRCRRRFEQAPRRPMDLRGKCFNCLSSTHFVAECRRPTRCFHCRLLGHQARCPTLLPVEKGTSGKPPRVQGRRVQVWQRLEPPVSSSVFNHRMSVWQRIGPQLPQSKISHSPAAEASLVESNVLSHSGKKRRWAKRRREVSWQSTVPEGATTTLEPSPGVGTQSRMKTCVIEFSTAMAREEAALRRALFVSIFGSRPKISGAEVRDEVARAFGIDVNSISIHQSSPEDFLLLLPDESSAESFQRRKNV